MQFLRYSSWLLLGIRLGIQVKRFVDLMTNRKKNRNLRSSNFWKCIKIVNRTVTTLFLYHSKSFTILSGGPFWLLGGCVRTPRTPPPAYEPVICLSTQMMFFVTCCKLEMLAKGPTDGLCEERLEPNPPKVKFQDTLKKAKLHEQESGVPKRNRQTDCSEGWLCAFHPSGCYSGGKTTEHARSASRSTGSITLVFSWLIAPSGRHRDRPWRKSCRKISQLSKASHHDRHAYRYGLATVGIEGNVWREKLLLGWLGPKCQVLLREEGGM